MADSLHIGGFHSNAQHAFSLTYRGRPLMVSATQLARAVNRIVPGTSFTYDHLITCCAARPTGSAGLFARLRGRTTLAYDEIVGINGAGRYLQRMDGSPLPYNHMVLFDYMGYQLGRENFIGLRRNGSLANP